MALGYQVEETDIYGSSLGSPYILPLIPKVGSQYYPNSNLIGASAVPVLFRANEWAQPTSAVCVKRIEVTPEWDGYSYVDNASNYLSEARFCFFVRARAPDATNYTFSSSQFTPMVNIWDARVDARDTPTDFVDTEGFCPFVLHPDEGLYIRFWALSGAGAYALTNAGVRNFIQTVKFLKVKVFYDNYRYQDRHYGRTYVTPEVSSTSVNTLQTVIDLTASAVSGSYSLSSLDSSSTFVVDKLTLQSSSPFFGWGNSGGASNRFSFSIYVQKLGNTHRNYIRKWKRIQQLKTVGGPVRYPTPVGSVNLLEQPLELNIDEQLNVEYYGDTINFSTSEPGGGVNSPANGGLPTFWYSGYVHGAGETLTAVDGDGNPVTSTGGNGGDGNISY